MVGASNFGWKLQATISDTPYKYGTVQNCSLQLPSEITGTYHIYRVCCIELGQVLPSIQSFVHCKSFIVYNMEQDILLTLSGPPPSSL